MNSIDYVFPYVDCNDEVWHKNYINERKNLNLSTDINLVRFRKWDNLRYIFRGIEKNMPWVRKIHMIVSNPEQVPDWINTDKVHIVYHKDIIPEEFLPTFNSCTIEMFLKNIPDLSDRFIYSNDDIFPISPLKEEDFYENNIPKLFYKTDSGQQTMFKKVEYGCQKLIADYLGIELPNPLEEFIKIPHTFTPMTKETTRVVSAMFKNEIYNSCTPFRKEKNYNQYIYTSYQLLTKQYLDSDRNYKYFQFKKDAYSIDKAKQISDAILNHKVGSICINDTKEFNTDEEFNYIKKIINTAFNEIFPEKSIYELNEIELANKDYSIIRKFDKIVVSFAPKDKYEENKFISKTIDLIKEIKDFGDNSNDSSDE